MHTLNGMSGTGGTCRAALGGLWLAASLCGWAAGVSPSDWAFRQDLRVEASGGQKVALPAPLLHAAQPDLSDLRLLGPDGAEMPYLVERVRPIARVVRPPLEQRIEVQAEATRVWVKRDGSPRLQGVILHTPNIEFLKPVTVEAEVAGGGYEVLAANQPVFRQTDGANQMFVAVPETTATSLRVTLDDRRTPAIPVLGVHLSELEEDAVPDEPVAVTIKERFEVPGETRLVLDLGAANLALGELRVETPEPLFTRRITLLTRRVEDGELRERGLAAGTIFRVALEGAPAVAQLTVPVEAQVHAREIVLAVEHGDSPPLELSAVHLTRRPVFLVFVSRSAGLHTLLAGNPGVPAPRYDVTELGGRLRGLPPSQGVWGPPGVNPEHRMRETLPSVPLLGAEIDAQEWAFRKRILPAAAGMQQLELDLEVLSRSRGGLADLRLVTAARQVPYLVDRATVPRSIPLEVSVRPDPDRPGWSRWSFRLPHPALPLTRLVCEVSSPLFEREMSLYEEPTDERGGRWRRGLGAALWRQTPGRLVRQFTLNLTSTPETDLLWLETRDGDNPPILVRSARAVYPAPRLVFQHPPGMVLDLYYGNPKASAPGYDLSLIADQVLTVPRTGAELGPEEQLRAGPWATGGRGGTGRGTWVLWGAMGLVVVGLLVVMARLLPARHSS